MMGQIKLLSILSHVIKVVSNSRAKCSAFDIKIELEELNLVRPPYILRESLSCLLIMLMFLLMFVLMFLLSNRDVGQMWLRLASIDFS